MTNIDPLQVVTFWFGDLSETGRASSTHESRWWSKDSAFDQEIRDRFLGTYKNVVSRSLEGWLTEPKSRLAYIIVLDQFSRNMFRNTAEMYAADEQAQQAVLSGLEQEVERNYACDERAFFYMPLMHAEQLTLQNRCVELFGQLRQESHASNRQYLDRVYGFAVQHRDIVERFGRFPHRNELLGRDSTPVEVEFLKQPGSSF